MFPREKFQDIVYENVTSFQVLQRNFSTNTARVKLSNGETQALGVGGPYTVNGVESVYVGDIWVMAGQSNMRGHGYYKDGGGKTVIPDPTPSVHLFQSNETWAIATEPTHRLAESPRSVHHTISDPTVRSPNVLQVRGASLGLAFAQSYQKRNNSVPVGLIASAHGGTSLDQWLAMYESNHENPLNTTLYGAMLARIAKVGGNIAGILWYQGETDACSDKSNIYYDRIQLLFSRMRFDMDYEVPIVSVQLGRCISDSSIKDERWNDVRKAQYEYCMINPTVPGSATIGRLCAVSSIDASLDDHIHLSAHGLAKVGHRLGIAATYALQKKAYMASPRISCVQYEVANECGTKRCTIKVTFEHMNNDTWSPVEEVLGFNLYDSDNCDLPIILSARIEGDRNVRIYLTGVAERLSGSYTLYYGSGKSPRCNLSTTSGMGLLATAIPFDI
ncbi:SGNH hydrolase-type esterase domain-containing protein [Fennellomyces sp. T-0311]|nr:SGNH hydrolase-type esterase domain-containing protein [Fennellomyces sp. T-0311]